jgi:hypothetical protein
MGDPVGKINEVMHDSLCPVYGDASVSTGEAGDFKPLCQCELINKVRAAVAEEAASNNPANDLGFKAVVAEKICGSEPFMWLMNGSNHVNSQLDQLKPLYLRYLAEGGGWGKANQPKKV